MSDANIRIVNELYAAFLRGDVQAIMQHVSDDLRHFGVVSNRQLLPWHVQITKKADVPLFFKAIADSAEFTRFEPRDFAAAGDHVDCTISFDVTFRRNGKKITHDNAVHHFTFKNGKVVEWRATEDTAATSAAFNA